MMPIHELDYIRDTDRWLRKAVVWIPIISFIVGWGTGVVTTFVIFKDHDRRISEIEGNQYKQEQQISSLEARQRSVITILDERFHVHIP